MESLQYSLTFLYVAELKELAQKLHLPITGKKLTLIHRIIHYVINGKIMITLPYPQVSCAQKGRLYPLHPDTLMLKNAYKNDLKTRLFFKQFIGQHFHFTAFGIDWLEERWMQGNPPTYNEFALMWEQEYQRRKIHPVAPKEEWAYINFIQKYLLQNPHASQTELHAAWHHEREKQRAYVFSCIRSLTK